METWQTFHKNVRNWKILEILLFLGSFCVYSEPFLSYQKITIIAYHTKLTNVSWILCLAAFNLNINLEHGNFCTEKNAADLNILVSHIEYGPKEKLFILGLFSFQNMNQIQMLRKAQNIPQNVHRNIVQILKNIIFEFYYLKLFSRKKYCICYESIFFLSMSFDKSPTFESSNLNMAK